MRIRVKICGITDGAGLRSAVESGADCLGFVFAESERQVSPETAAALCSELPGDVRRVAVFRHPAPSAVARVLSVFSPDVVQSEPDEGGHKPAGAEFLPVFHDSDDLVDRVRTYREEFGGGLILLEGVGRGGRGTKADWGRAAQAARLGPMALAGGLTPDNVMEAVRLVRPFGVDVSSGVESAPGIKDPHKVHDFIEAVREAGMELQGGAAT